jgi:hypothetical protein
MSDKSTLLLERIGRTRLKPFNRLAPRNPLGTPRSIPIEDNVPIPELKKYPLAFLGDQFLDVISWGALGVGQSCLAPWPEPQLTQREKRQLQNRVAARVYQQNRSRSNSERAQPRCFIQRSMSDGIRIWRIR